MRRQDTDGPRQFPIPQLETSHLPLPSELPSPRSLFGGTPSFSLRLQWALPSSLPWPQSSFIFIYIFTESVGRRILLVVPVDTLYRTSIISSSTVLNPFTNLSLALLSLFSIYGPDLGEWPDCWVSAEFLRAPIPRKGSGSTTTTTGHWYQSMCDCASLTVSIMFLPVSICLHMSWNKIN